MNARRSVKVRLCASLLTLIALTLAALPAQASEGVEASYHGQLGYGTGLGMLEKWCALPNFSYYQQGGITGWYDASKRDCSNCHIGAQWSPDADRKDPDCGFCHSSENPGGFDDEVTVAACMSCHKKDVSKRGDDFSADNDVHIAAGFMCQDCHRKYDDGVSDHQFLKGTAMDTTEPTMMGTLDCTSSCHDGEGLLQGHGLQPHDLSKANGETLNQHTEKVACETCHTGLRPNAALASRQWNVFTPEGKPLTVMREPGFVPEYKWYDNTGPGEPGDFRLPILGYTERRNAPGAKIYPFNPVTVDWFVKTKQSEYDEVIPVPEVKAADFDADGTVTVEEMRQVYKHATLKQADMNFSISHSVLPAADAFVCKDCHSRLGWVLDWRQLGYADDPAKELVDDKKPKK